MHQELGWLGQKRLSNWRDRFESGNLWIRSCAPDRAAGAFGGVPLPKVFYALPDGRYRFVRVNFSGFAAMVNREKSIPGLRRRTRHVAIAGTAGKGSSALSVKVSAHWRRRLIWQTSSRSASSVRALRAKGKSARAGELRARGDGIHLYQFPDARDAAGPGQSSCPGRPPAGAPLRSVMDDEIVTDSAGSTIFVLSRPSERLCNAGAENGVTWVN